MKFLSIIFVIYVGGLTIQSSLSVLTNYYEAQEFCNEQYCSDKQSCGDRSCDEQKNNVTDCCPGGICNPFESCACCFGFDITKPIIEITENNINVNYIRSEIRKVHYGYGSDCFHPPKVV